MKKLLLIACALMVTASYTFAQNAFTYTYDATKSGNGAPLVGAASVYCHSGGNDVAGPLDGTCWAYTVGNWGADDGIGKMTSVGTDMWQIALGDAVAYYSQASNGPVPGTSILRVGMVFRNADGSVGGKDANDSDIFGDLSGATPAVFNSDLTPFDGVVISVNTGINEINNGTFASTVYPNPASSEAMFAYTLNQGAKNITVRVINQIGQQVNVYNRYNQANGTYLIHFNAADLANGLYSYSVNVDETLQTGKFIVAK